jgi:CBS-domain-containing membrane protein
MKVKELMEIKVRSCLVDDSLNWAAQLMWEGDCGALPVVGPEGDVVGMITDRDICMAAYTKGRPLTLIKVGDAMAKQVTTCSAESSAETAMSLMKEVRVRRLPIVDAQGKLAGILSLNDLAPAPMPALAITVSIRPMATAASAMAATTAASSATSTCWASKPAARRAGQLVAVASEGGWSSDEVHIP